MPAAGQRCRQNGADPGGRDLGALGRVMPSKCQNNSAHRLLLPYLAVLVSPAEHGMAAAASLVLGSGLSSSSARSLCPGRLFWPFAGAVWGEPGSSLGLSRGGWCHMGCSGVLGDGCVPAAQGTVLSSIS